MKEISRKTKAKGDLPGSIYLRGKVYWIKYYKDGKPLRESARTGDFETAQAELAKRINEVKHGKTPNIQLPRVKFDDLSEDFLRDYRINGRKSLARAKFSVMRLEAFFGWMRVIDIDTSKIYKYVEGRLNEGMKNSTINRELAALKRMLSLGAQCKKVEAVPYIPMLKEDNVRKNFFEKADFLALREALPDYLKPVVTFAYKTGWRIGEISSLKWSNVDLNNWTVRLNPGETKNDKGRIIYLDTELQGIIADLWQARKVSGRLTEYVFMNADGTGSIKRITTSWKTACRRVGIPEYLFHDFRRTAVRNMVRANTPEVVAMKISGHKTRAIFDRYNIVSEEDLKQAAMRHEEYLKSVPGTKTGTIIEMYGNTLRRKSPRHQRLE
jgi:integrase